MKIFEKKSLQKHNSLALAANARYFVQIEQQAEIPEALAWAEARGLPVLVLGGGSNLVLATDFQGLVLHIALKGVQSELTSTDTVDVLVAAGENWDELVKQCINNGWHGLENLISIPGCAGAAPIQNIGAYGVELSSVLKSVNGWNCVSSRFETLSAEQCLLAYRDSIFKGQLKDKFIITEICLSLSSEFNPQIDYPALKHALGIVDGKQAFPKLDARTVANAVATVRASKLPDPKELPNAGSFFKNPIVSTTKFEQLKARYPELPHWPMSDGTVKLAAAWLVDFAGLKGTRQGQVGIHQHQAIVLVNHGEASGADVVAFAQSVSTTVEAIFGLQLEIEPRVYQ